ncbi:MAG: PAS domain-containing protein [Sulfuricellaceae bacterium]
MSPLLQAFSNRIGRRLALLSVVIGVLLVPLLSGLVLFQDYQNRAAQLERHLDEIAGASQPALREALWLGDASLVRTHLAGLKSIHNMALVQLEQADKPTEAVGRRPAAGVPVFERQVAIRRTFRDKELTLGTLTLVVSLEPLRRDLRHEAWLIVLAQTLQVTVVAGLILFGFHRIAGRRLHRMAEYLTGYRRGITVEHMVSSEGAPLCTDELDRLACEFDHLTERLAEEQNLLEQRVAQRTQELHASESNLKRAQAVAHLGSWQLDVVSNDLTWSEETYRIFGVADGIPLTYTDFLSRIYPEDRDAVNTAWQAALHGALYDIAHRIVVDGQIKWVREQAEFVFDNAGQLTVGIGTAQDITAQVLAEQALQQKAEELKEAQRIAHLGSWRLDMATNQVVWSEELYRILGLNPALPPPDFVAHQKLLTPESWNRLNEALPRAREAGVPYELELEMIRQDGSKGWMLARGEALRDAGGAIVGLHGVALDITERKQVMQELKRSNAELEQFSYAISHDMRQPLRMISSYLQLLEKRLAGQLDGEKREFFNFAIDGAQRLDKMLVALLEYSRVGRKGEPPEWVASRKLLDEALLFLQPAINEAQAGLSVGGDWPRVFVSRDEIMRLLQNLVGNAVKYRVAGRRPEIVVTSETVGNEWRLTVTDNGVGILPDQIHRLFQMFQRLHTRAAYEGAGVGLALCRKIVEHHGGRIGASSQGEGLGSTFWVNLPLQAPAAPEMPTHGE